MKSKLQLERLQKALREAGVPGKYIPTVIVEMEGDDGEPSFDQLGMEDEVFGFVPETVILDAQRRVYEHKDNVTKEQEVVRKKEEELREAQTHLAYAKRQLVETIQFLELWNRDAHEDWFAEIGVERPEFIKSNTVPHQ